MRITQTQRLRSSLRDIQSAERAVSKLSEQVSSGRAVVQPSDDPIRVSRGLRLRSELRALEAYGLNAEIARTELESIDASFQQLTNVLSRARELAVQGSSENLTPADRDLLAEELEGLLQQAVALGNSRHDGRFLFGGVDVDTPPFELQDVAGVTTAVYNGSDVRREIRIEQEDIPIGQAGGPPFTGAGGAIDSLIALRDAMRTGTADDVRNAMSGVDDGLQNVTLALGEVGARQGEVQSLLDGIADKEILVEQVRSAVEDVDLSKAIVELQDRQSSYQRSLQVVAKVLEVSILDYLR